MGSSRCRQSTVAAAILSLILAGVGIAALILVHTYFSSALAFTCPMCSSMVYAPVVTIAAGFITLGMLGIAGLFVNHRAVAIIVILFTLLCMAGVIYLHYASLLFVYFSQDITGSLQRSWLATTEAARCTFNAAVPCRGWGDSCLEADIFSNYTAECPDCAALGYNIAISVPRCGTAMVFSAKSYILPTTTILSGLDVLLMLTMYIYILRIYYEPPKELPPAPLERKESAVDPQSTVAATTTSDVQPEETEFTAADETAVVESTDDGMDGGNESNDQAYDDSNNDYESADDSEAQE